MRYRHMLRGVLAAAGLVCCLAPRAAARRSARIPGTGGPQLHADRQGGSHHDGRRRLLSVLGLLPTMEPPDVSGRDADRQPGRRGHGDAEQRARRHRPERLADLPRAWARSRRRARRPTRRPIPARRGRWGSRRRSARRSPTRSSRRSRARSTTRARRGPTCRSRWAWSAPSSSGRRPAPTRPTTSTESKFDREFLFLLSEIDSHIHDMVDDALTQRPVDRRRGRHGRPQHQPAPGQLLSRTTGSSTAATRRTRWPTTSRGPLSDAALRLAGEGAHGRRRADARDRRRPRPASVPPPRQPRARDRGGRQPAAEREPASWRGTIDLSHLVFTDPVGARPDRRRAVQLERRRPRVGRLRRAARRGASATTCATACRARAPASTRRPHEWCADHGKKIPVIMQDQLGIDQGEFYSGSPFLGFLGPKQVGSLQPEPGRRLHVHVALPHGKRDHQLRHFPRRHDDDAHGAAEERRRSSRKARRCMTTRRRISCTLG